MGRMEIVRRANTYKVVSESTEGPILTRLYQNRRWLYVHPGFEDGSAVRLSSEGHMNSTLSHIDSHKLLTLSLSKLDIVKDKLREIWKSPNMYLRPPMHTTSDPLCTLPQTPYAHYLRPPMHTTSDPLCTLPQTPYAHYLRPPMHTTSDPLCTLPQTPYAHYLRPPMHTTSDPLCTLPQTPYAHYLRPPMHTTSDPLCTLPQTPYAHYLRPPMHTTSDPLCTLPQTPYAHYLRPPMHTTSDPLCTLPQTPYAHYLRPPMHTTSDPLCILYLSCANFNLRKKIIFKPVKFPGNLFQHCLLLFWYNNLHLLRNDRGEEQGGVGGRGEEQGG